MNLIFEGYIYICVCVEQVLLITPKVIASGEYITLFFYTYVVVSAQYVLMVGC